MNIQPPTNCPSCEAELVWKNQLLYCVNPNCGAQTSKQIEHWAKILKIKGLGPVAIEKLQIGSIVELYSLNTEHILDSLKSNKLAEKLEQEIEASKEVELSLLIAGFGIPLVGKTAGIKLAQVITSIEDIDETSCKAAKLGPQATNNLLRWKRNEWPSYKGIFKPKVLKVVNTDKGTVCITGKLVSYKTKAQAAKVLTDAGYKVKDTVTKDVTILVNESGIESTKTEKARSAGVTIVTNINLLLGD